MAYDYASLTAAINSWSERTYTSAQTDEFIMLAEAEINTQLAGYQREITVDTATDDDGDIPLPTGFAGVSTLIDSTGDHYGYSISGSTLHVTDAVAQDVTLVYYAKLSPLTVNTTTNWLLDAQPGVYLMYCKSYQRAYEEDWQAAAIFKAQAKALLTGFLMQNAITQFGRAGLRLAVAP